MKQIKLTKELFFDTLPKLKKYKPVVTRRGLIRLGRKKKGYTMCPLTALRKELIGVAGDITKIEDYFTNDALCARIVHAADSIIHYSKLRKQILKELGL